MEDLTKDQIKDIFTTEIICSGLKQKYIYENVGVSRTTLHHRMNGRVNVKYINELRRLFAILPSLREKIFPSGV